jgi:hypothetical protein
VIIFPVRQVTFASSSFKFISGKSLKFFFDAKSYGKKIFFETSDFLKLDGMHELDVRREDSAGVLLLVVPDGMIFPNGDAKNYTSVPISSL